MNVLVLVIFAAAVFYIGLISFRVEEDSFAIMNSKTSGLYECPVEYGSFLWRWERLLPTNVTLEYFSLSDYSEEVSIRGALPSQATYASLLDKKFDFSYSADITVLFRKDAGIIYDLYSSDMIHNEEDLNEYFNRCADSIGKYLVSKAIEQGIDLTLKTNDELISICSDYITDSMMVASISVNGIKMPDYELYEKAKLLFEGYHKELEENLKIIAVSEAEKMADENRNLARIERLGELMAKYPDLKDLFQNADMNNIVSSLKGL